MLLLNDKTDNIRIKKTLKLCRLLNSNHSTRDVIGQGQVREVNTEAPTATQIRIPLV